MYIQNIQGASEYYQSRRYIASAPPAQKTPFYYCNVFTESSHSNGRGADRIENKSRDS
jgi:hypothetical protein